MENCFVLKLCFSSLSLDLSSKLLDICTAWKCFPLPHPRQVWPYAEQTAFLLWWVYFDTFRLISNSPTSNQLNKIHHHDRHVALDSYRYSAYVGFDCHRLSTFYEEIASTFFWRPGFSRVLCSVFSASKSCGSVNRGFHSQFL